MFQLIFLQHFTNHSLTSPTPIYTHIPVTSFHLKAQTFLQPSITTTRYHNLSAHNCQFRLPTSICPLPTSDFPLPSANFHLLSSVFRLPSTNFRLPSSDFQLPSANFPTLTPFLVIRTRSPVSYNSHYLLIKHLVLCQKLVTTS
jgi:hypothetical protein